jgi:internalin A
MKSHSSNLMTLFVIGICFLSTIPFQSCKHEDEPVDHCDSCIIALKPNIYLYPQQKTKLTVQLSFPLGGSILTSIPAYGNGWNITVDTNGVINNQYNNLFYESEQPNIWQHYEGWVVKSTDLKSFFTENMAKYGFNEQEIADFTNYWVPRLTNFGYYIIYPQTTSVVNIVIALKISKQPDNMLRLFYLITGCNKPPAIAPSEPIIAPFSRNGFVLAEWGVLLK